MQGSIGIFNSPEEQQRQWEECRRGIVPDNPSMGMQIPSVHDPSMAPAGKHAASAFAFAFPVETNRDMHGQLKNVMAEKVQQTVAESRWTGRRTSSACGTVTAGVSGCRGSSVRTG